MSMPHRVRIYRRTSPIHRPPCYHPPCKASGPAVTREALPPVTAVVNCRGYGSGGAWMPHESEEATAVQVVRQVVVGGARLVLGTRTHPYPYPIPPLLLSF